MASPRTYDRIRSFGGGVDGYRPASEIGANQSQVLENVIIRDNYEARTRPGADALAAAFAADTVGPVQGLVYYDTPAGKKLVQGQGGKLYAWDGAAWSAALAGYALSDGLVPFVAAQGVDKLLISDGVQNLRVYDGANFTDCLNGQLNAPVGATILTWHGGRMFASGVAAAPDTIWVSNRLQFGPGQWNSATRSFRVGDGDGEAIVAQASMQNFNLAVLKENSVWLVNADPRNEPADYSADQAADRVGSGIGCVGRQAWCVFQNDLLFMSQDGVQSLQRMQAAAGQYELTAPLSLPIQPWIDRINWAAAAGIVGAKYRHLAFFFVPLDASLYNNYALVWNGRLGQWMGVFTGWTPSAAAVTRFGNQIRLVFGDHDGKVNQWKDYAGLSVDATYLDNGADYASKLWSRALVFGNADAQKKLRAGLLRFNGGNAVVRLSASLDATDDETWQEEVEPAGDLLPAMLPMALAGNKPLNAYRSLEDLPYCNEMFFKVEAAKGWWALRNLTASAFLKPMRTDA